jgi:hypothetical protein
LASAGTKLITLSPGTYSTETLGQEIASKINSAYGWVDTTSNTTGTTINLKNVNAVTSTYNAALKRFTITSPTYNFRIITDEDPNLASKCTAAQTTRSTFLPQSANPLIKNFYNSLYSGTQAKTFSSGFVDMMPIRNLYIHAIGMGNFSTTTLSGTKSVIKKVPVTGNYGDVMVDTYATGMDFCDCSHQTLSRIGFKLTDHAGRVVELNGCHWSFSIVFSRTEMGD